MTLPRHSQGFLLRLALSRGLQSRHGKRKILEEQFEPAMTSSQNKKTNKASCIITMTERTEKKKNIYETKQ